MAKKNDIILPGIAGLKRQAAQMREQAGWCATSERKASKDPHEAYDAGVRSAELLKKAEAAEAHARDNAAVVLCIDTILLGLNNSEIKSAYRTRALQKLEEASMILRREIGD